MEPEEITSANWVEKLVEYLDPKQEPLAVEMREHLSEEGQSAMRTLRNTLPQYQLTVRTEEEG